MAKKDKGSKKKKADKAAPPSDAVIQLPPTPPLEPDHVIHPRVAQRLAVGRDAREKVPRASLGDWTAPPNRFDPVDILEAQSSTRLQDLVPIRYGRMSVTPFTFLRGAAGIMAADLATQVRTPLDTQLCGDCHNLNFGVYGCLLYTSPSPRD